MGGAGIEVGAGLVSRAWTNVRNDWARLDLRQRIARFASHATDMDRAVASIARRPSPITRGIQFINAHQCSSMLIILAHHSNFDDSFSVTVMLN